MIFTETKLKGVFIIQPERIEDERGFFARIWDRKSFKGHGLEFDLVEASISLNKKKGTLRGMHYQKPPHGETKLVRCTRGRIFDVVIDLRPGSETFKQWFGVELSEENAKTLYIPRGFAHGFITLEDESEIHYQMDQEYKPGSAHGIKWDDKTFNISWPMEPVVISEKDSSWKPFSG